MATKLSDIRFLIEREVKDSIENEDVVSWCNQVNADIGTNINIPANTPLTIALTPTDLQYSLTADLKIINRLRLQSVLDQGIDTELAANYRIYNGKIIFPRTFWSAPDTLLVDYYKHMTYFADISDVIDLPDRLNTVYTFYGLIKYYKQPTVLQRMGEAQARKEAETAERMYFGMKDQVVSYFSLGDEPVVVNRRW